MLQCPECRTYYPNGTIACLNDGHEFVQTEESRQLARSIGHGVIFVPALVIRIEEIEGAFFEEPVPKIAITRKRLRESQIRIGRRDYRKDPPTVPEIDFHNFFANSVKPPCVSRLHAIIEMQGADICLRSIQFVQTFVRRSSEPIAVALIEGQPHKLANEDTIYLANPKKRHIRLRVLMA